MIGDDSTKLELFEATTKQEIEKLAKLSTAVHDESVGLMTKALAFHHPMSAKIHWLAYREKKSGDLVSTLCLIPWTLRYRGIQLPAGELGIVGTRKDWRGKGLIRALTACFDQIVSDEGYLLSHIQGIAYFYRQFGYEYAVPLETQVYLEFRHVVEMNKGRKSAGVSLRRATPTDIEFLMEKYAEHNASLGVHAERDKLEWKYLLGASMKSDYAMDTYVAKEGRRNVGYCRIPRFGFGEALILGECSDLGSSAFPGFFGRLAAIAQEQKKPFIRLNLEPTHPAVKAAVDSGAQQKRGYGWQIKIPDICKMIRAIKPALTASLAKSEFADFNGTLKLNWYRGRTEIQINSGRIGAVKDKADLESCDINIPPNLFAPLILGQRSVEECHRTYPDFSGDSRMLRLFSTMFPEMPAFLHCPY